MERAALYYEQSAAQGHSGAQSCLGTCFLLGCGVKMDKRKALEYFTLAALQGDANGQFNGGLMRVKGDGVERDFVEALKFWELAAAQDHQRARQNLVRLLAHVFGNST